jgi:hypothetical protein
MIPNDTYGKITRAELDAMRASAGRCTTCGMLATVDPVFHATRYGHAPVIAGPDGARLEWDGLRWSKPLGHLTRNAAGEIIDSRDTSR